MVRPVARSIDENSPTESGAMSLKKGRGNKRRLEPPKMCSWGATVIC